MNQSILLPLVPTQIGSSSISTPPVTAATENGNVGASVNLQAFMQPILPSPTVTQDNVLHSQTTFPYSLLPDITIHSEVPKKSTRIRQSTIPDDYMVYLQ